MRTAAKCEECGRVFDLLDEDEAGEWYYGHDCETVGQEEMPQAAEAAPVIVPDRGQADPFITALAAGMEERDAFTLALYGTDENPRDLLIAAAYRVMGTKCHACRERFLDLTDPDARDAAGCELCAPCFHEAGLENEHSDGYHEADQDGPNSNCPDCMEVPA